MGHRDAKQELAGGLAAGAASEDIVGTHECGQKQEVPGELGAGAGWEASSRRWLKGLVAGAGGWRATIRSWLESYWQ